MEGGGCLSNQTNGYTVIAAQLVHILDICRLGGRCLKATVVRDLWPHTCIKTESVIAEPSWGRAAAASFSRALRPHSTTSHNFWNNSVLDFCAQGNPHIVQKKWDSQESRRHVANTFYTTPLASQQWDGQYVHAPQWERRDLDWPHRLLVQLWETRHVQSILLQT